MMSIKEQIYVAAMTYRLTGNKPLVYISGKVTDLPPAEVSEKFQAAETRLQELGFETFNPTKWIRSDADWQFAMKLCLAVLPMCDSICLLHDWHISKGAKIERDTALLLGLPTIEL